MISSCNEVNILSNGWVDIHTPCENHNMFLASSVCNFSWLPMFSHVSYQDSTMPYE